MQYESKVVQIQNGATISVPATFVNAHGRRPNAFHIKEQKCLFQNEEEKVVQKKKKKEEEKDLFDQTPPQNFHTLIPSIVIHNTPHSFIIGYI